MSNLKAYGRRVIIERSKSKEKVGPLWLPNQKALAFGKAVSVGVEVQGVNVGDLVYFTSFSGSEIEYDDKKFIIIEDVDILATLSSD